MSTTPLDVAVVDRHVVTRDYRVAGTPLLVALTADRTVHSAVAGGGEASVRRFVRSFRRAIGAAGEEDRSPNTTTSEEVITE
jgi:hypothetical protein